MCLPIGSCTFVRILLVFLLLKFTAAKKTFCHNKSRNYDDCFYLRETDPANITCSKYTIETLEEDGKYVQS